MKIKIIKAKELRKLKITCNQNYKNNFPKFNKFKGKMNKICHNILLNLAIKKK